MIKSEGKTEAMAVSAAIKELGHLQKVQKEAVGVELKAQQKTTKYSKIEHKAKMR